MKVSSPVTPHLRIGSGPPLLLLHPFSTSWRAWRPVAEILARDFDVFAPTLPGHLGGPAAPPSAPVASFVPTIEAMMDGIGWTDAFIAGNSLGGWIALDLARRGRAKTVIAFAPAGGWRKNTWPAIKLGISFVPWYPFARLFQGLAPTLMARPGMRRALLRWGMEHGERLTHEDAMHLLESFAGCEVYWDVLFEGIGSDGIQGMPEVRCPVHLVFSEFDRVVPMSVYGTRFIEELPHATREILPDAGHTPMLESPERVAAIIRKHAQ